MAEITKLFEKLSLNDNVDDLINEFSKLSINCINDNKEMNNMINSFDNLSIENQKKCMNILYNTQNTNIRIFLEKIGEIIYNRYNRKCFIGKIFVNNNCIC